MFAYKARWVPDTMNILLAYTILFGLMIVGYEYRSNYDLNESRKDNGGLIFNRLRLSAQTSWMVDDIEQAVFVLEVMIC